MKTLQILVLFSITLLLFGCGEKDETSNTQSPFVGGTNGLLVTFMENYPPPEVFDGGQDPFDIVLRLNNEGEFDIPASQLRVRISGIQSTMFGKVDGQLNQVFPTEIKGKYKDFEGNIIEGAEETIEFTDLNHGSSLAGTISYTIWADICYLYGGTATTKLCFMKDLRDTGDERCAVTGPKQVDNSGGPLQVTSFNQNVMGTDKIGFTFKIEKRGNGEVYKDTLADCNNDEYEDRNKVWVEVETEQAGLICRGLRDGTDSTKGYARLTSQGALISCDQPANVATDFEAPVNIVFKYKYGEDVNSGLLVKHTPE